jgi:thiol-disulfide isomerase/thioredoxin
MIRLLAVAVFSLLPLAAIAAQAGADKGKEILKIAEKLTVDDPMDKVRNAHCKIHVVKLKSGRMYTIDMVSSEFDSYLRLEDDKGSQLAEDDDGGGNLNARIEFTCSKDGDYKVICTAFAPEGMGNFTLTVKETVSTAKLITSHQSLIGKLAPDFRSDFTLNGDAKKLEDLKGKVVILGFWEVRSGPSRETIPLLAKWAKEFKSDGFEVIGLTFYNYEIGQYTGFDAKTGKVVAVPEADKKSEQAMLKEFAAHHKLDYLLMALNKDDALKTFDTYAVSSFPQLVLIDRKGMVRSVVVGEKSAPALESEIKKLLAEQ